MSFDSNDLNVAKQVRRGRPPAAVVSRGSHHSTTEERRPNRADASRGERRRREGSGLDSNLRLSLPDHLKNDLNWRYHWLVDRPGRGFQKTRDDGWGFFCGGADGS